MNSIREAMLRAWCKYRNMEYVEGHVNPLPSDNFEKGFIAGTSSQWKDPNIEVPIDDRQVLVETDCKDNELRHAISYFLAGAWHFPDDWYYDCRVLKWMYIPLEKGGLDETD